jgi:hypothetical protein
VSRLNIARALMLIGMIVGLESLRQTFFHIGDPLYTLPPEFGGGETHAWYHALREAVGDVATIVVMLLVFFGSPRFRNMASWWICLVLLIGYYSPFWVGIPFNSALAAPSIAVDLRHFVQAAIPLGALLIARPAFVKG